MKKNILLSLLLLCSTGSYAQFLKIDSVEEIKLSQPIEKIQLAPSGDYVLLSKYNNQGISKLNLKTKQVKTVTDAKGAGYNTLMLENGDILFREVSSDPSRNVTIKKYSEKTEQTKTIVASTQENILPVNATAADKIQTNQDFLLQLTMDGKTSILAPLGEDVRYLWPSLSPDGKQIVFVASGIGCYICGTDGKNATELGQLRAPKWLGNNIIVGQRDSDNGEVVTASHIIAKNIQTKDEQVLTNDSTIAMNPSVSKACDKILFSTPQGQAFIIHLNNK